MRKYSKKVKAQVTIPIILHKTGSGVPFAMGTVDYKNIALLRKFISVEGKILPRRVTGLTAKEQRNIATAIKTARVVGLLPFINQ
uniref:Small ribosomal subunit protein bS18c n=1 Tax=Capsosiphon fulvescens TaxID=205396 RepID=A0A3G1RIT8_9CHLO|nr:ribosomal protein S18 [Capsosiphon fulvescens]AWX64053.1 ribosomal protein S18 [Capsosiphon fulvescens]AYV89970.1 ribosomal protein S18 [Capsosiphon fulvescens]